MAAFPGLLYKSFYNSEITDNRRIIFEITSAEKNNSTIKNTIQSRRNS